MKYIRTKDEIYGVYFVKDNGVNIETKAYFETKDKRFFLHDFILNEKIIKQADTIEELCDEFALFYMETKNPTPIPWATYERRGVWEKEREHIIKEIVSHPSYRQPILKGAIWTDNGLIYVAKMNDKGELELL